MTPFDIDLKRGAGPLRFGMTAEEVVELMGPPSLREVDSDGDIALEYQQAKICLVFGAEYDFKLSNIEVYAPVTLNGKQLGPHEKEIIDMFLIVGVSLQDRETISDGEFSMTSADGYVMVFIGLSGGLISVSFSQPEAEPN